MDWLSKPKVLLGLSVNVVYLLFCLSFAYSPPPSEADFFAAEKRARAERRALVHVPLPPPSGPSEAATYFAKESGELNVFLTNDLTLVRRPDHTLLLSPTFAVKVDAVEMPRNVLLRFVSFSSVQYFDDECLLVIAADGNFMWPPVAARGPGWGRMLPHSITTDGQGRVVETLAAELPYEEFIELISARQVVITLGPDSVELTAEQVEALRDMHRRLPQPPAETNAGNRAAPSFREPALVKIQ